VADSDPREASKLQHRSSKDIEVSFDPGLCIHAAECLRRLPGVFNLQQRPWIQPGAASAERVAATVERCPSGALKYTRLDGGAPESPDEQPLIRPTRNGPVYVRGAVTLEDGEGGQLAHVLRAALCRCGRSANKPFCDNAHRAAGFIAR